MFFFVFIINIINMVWQYKYAEILFAERLWNEYKSTEYQTLKHVLDF